LAARFSYTALNDVVINAGEPFRMIELEVQIDGAETAPFRSDGVLVATASGSTGYNLSAGGPLIAPDVRGMVLTPICPHSLSFRPVVVADTSTILVKAVRLNPGTAVNFDGQVSMKITEKDCVVVRRAPKPLRLVENPEMSHWGMLAHKLHWAQSPRG
jgi:NAD+ kinase